MNSSLALQLARLAVFDLKLLSLALVIALLSGCPSADVVPPLQLVEIAESSLQLGELYRSEINCVLPLVNRSEQEVFISSVPGDRTCSSISAANFTIPAKGQFNLNVRVNLTGKTGPFSIGLVARTPADYRPRQWTLQGQVHQFFANEPHDLTARARHNDRSLLIERPVNIAIQDLNVEVQTPFECINAAIQDGVLRLQLDLPEKFPFGTNKTTIRIQGQTPQGNDVDLRIPLFLERVRPFSVIPQVANLGRVPVGTSLSMAVRVNFDEILDKISVQSNSEEVEVQVVNRQLGDQNSSADLDIRVINAGPGFQNRKLTVEARLEGHDITFDIPVNYYGVEK